MTNKTGGNATAQILTPHYLDGKLVNPAGLQAGTDAILRLLTQAMDSQYTMLCIGMPTPDFRQSLATGKISQLDCLISSETVSEVYEPRLRGYHNCQVIRGNAFAEPPSPKYDAIIISFGLSEVSYEKKTWVLEQCKRRLNFGGILIVREWNLPAAVENYHDLRIVDFLRDEHRRVVEIEPNAAPMALPSEFYPTNYIALGHYLAMAGFKNFELISAGADLVFVASLPKLEAVVDVSILNSLQTEQPQEAAA